MEDHVNINIYRLLEYIYSFVYENYQNIMVNENIAKVLDVKTNSMCKKWRLLDPGLTDREIQSKSFTLLYMLLLFTFSPQWLKE